MSRLAGAMLSGAILLFAPTAAHAAVGAQLNPGDGMLVVAGLAVAALIARRRRGLPDSCD